MKRSLPTPNDIIEELADKVASQIDRLAPTAFDSSLRELTRYHRFLLSLNTARAPDGTVVSYAQIGGYSFQEPHRSWIRQYRRLFERAANRIQDDDHFIRSLIYAPLRLLPGPEEAPFPPQIIDGILGLGPMMMHQLESWVTKRRNWKSSPNEDDGSRLTLVGFDAKVYPAVLIGFVGAWEGLLDHVPFNAPWREPGEHSDFDRWRAFRTSWPFLQKHLEKTSYCLAVAVWNEDEDGAAMLRDALTRWPKTLEYRLRDPADFKHRRLLFPDIFDLDWPQATARVGPLMYEHMPTPAPEEILSCVLNEVHNDYVILTAALLLYWSTSEVPASDLSGRTAKSLFFKEEGNDKGRPGPRKSVQLKSLFLDFVRLEMIGGGAKSGSYASVLNNLVETLDNLTERLVVPGRIFTPSALHHKDQLLTSFVAMLASVVPEGSDDKLRERIDGLSRDEGVLPSGDRSLRDVVEALDRVRAVLAERCKQLLIGIDCLGPRISVDDAITRLQNITQDMKSTVQSRRLERLKARPIDLMKVDGIRSAVEHALMESSFDANVFGRVSVERVAERDWKDRVFKLDNLSKAQFTDPPMESPSVSFQDSLAAEIKRSLTDQIWAEFCSRDHDRTVIRARLEEDRFWREIKPLLAKIGSDPVMAVSLAAEGRSLQRFMRVGPTNVSELRITHRDAAQRTSVSYLATIEGVDVFGSADVIPGVAWLFSGQALHRMLYAKLSEPPQHVAVEVDVSELQVSLSIRCRPKPGWNKSPIFELRVPDPDDLGD